MNNINNIIDEFRSGKVGIFPTDTAYGIGCRIDNVEAVKRVYSLRNRPGEKALIALVSSVEMAKEYVSIDKEIEEKLVKKYWPGGLTIVLRCKTDKVLGIVRAEGQTLAVRLPDHQVLRNIIEEVGVPIVAPSANYSGHPTPTKLEDIDKTLLSKVDFTLNGVCTMEGVSTIIDTTLTPWKIIRQGVVDVEEA